MGRPGVLAWHFSDDTKELGRIRRRDSGWTAENVRKGFSPATVIDVGAGVGTGALFAAFPDAHHVMIEPLEEFAPRLERRVAEQNAEYVPVAAGDEEGTATFHVDTSSLWQSSLLEATWRDPAARQERTIAVTTLDRLLAERAWAPPFGLKIDTEGFEDRVIRGAREVLAHTQFVIAEVSVWKRFEDSYTFADFIALMAAVGFVPCDVLDGLKTENGFTVFMDMVFVPAPRS
jgi:FkbM family methyltransferase